ncbi:MAG: hypothetical protein HC887_09020 [Desulfobacteraceae bacterium]|nr:hypothetical protein [Desulfobacteraceae bacterium]
MIGRLRSVLAMVSEKFNYWAGALFILIMIALGANIDKVIAKLKPYFSWDKWYYWTALLIAILILFLIIYAIWQYGKKKNAEAEDQKQSEALSFMPNTLAKKWNTFLKGIPTEFRRSLVLYQPFVVLGESGSGKTLMIDNYTDWKGQSRQFYPSYTSDPVIQFYLGSKILVQEIPGTLLDDTSEQARIALLKLWKPFFRGRNPKVVVAVNSMKLLTESSESLKKQAQTIRGKINLLSSKRSRPAQIGIALTFMNHVEGCSEFFDFLMQHQIPLKIEFESEKSSKEFVNCLEAYEDFLKNALMALPADNYLKIISFMRRIPEIFAVLSEFMQVLRNPDPLSVQPKIAYLCMVSDREKYSDLSNPFQTAAFSSEQTAILSTTETSDCGSRYADSGHCLFCRQLYL